MANVTSSAHASRYRWVVLGAFCLISAVTQVQWLTFAPIARQARAFYQVSALAIDLLSLVFMLIYVLGSIPAALLIERRGVRFAVGLGAVLTAGCGLLKSAYAESYSLVLVAQMGLAIAQPFLLNATTKLASDWFPLQQRALAVGLATLAQFVGIVAAMLTAPIFLQGAADPRAAIVRALFDYGVITALAAVVTVTLLRDAPSVERDNAPHVRPLDSVRRVFAQRDMRLMVALFFIGLGMFNAISTCIDQICESKGLDVEQTGLVGGGMLIAGIVGAIALPLLSDHYRRRRIFLVGCLACVLPALIGLAAFADYQLLLASSCVLGFFLLGGAAPIGFQFAAEVSHPVPESVAQGVILMAGQLSGIACIVGMNLIGMLVSLWIYVGFAAALVALAWLLDESPLILIDGIAAQRSR